MLGASSSIGLAGFVQHLHRHNQHLKVLKVVVGHYHQLQLKILMVEMVKPPRHLLVVGLLLHLLAQIKRQLGHQLRPPTVDRRHQLQHPMGQYHLARLLIPKEMLAVPASSHPHQHQRHRHRLRRQQQLKHLNKHDNELTYKRRIKALIE